jgi:SAM-dependent methyltransferase
MALRKRLMRLLLGEARAEAVEADRSARRMMRWPDRKTLIDTYLPLFAGRGGQILWIGCRDYTAAYPAALEAGGAKVWTIDIDPGQAKWGREGRHRIGDMTELAALFPDVLFDAVLCNGVFGHGVDAPEAQASGLAAIASVLKPGGLLLLGWNTDRMADPLLLAAPWFQPTAAGDILPRTRYADATHVYDLLTRTPG